MRKNRPAFRKSMIMAISQEPLATYARHCQKLSTRLFSVTMLPRSGPMLSSGELKSWQRPTASGEIW